MDKRESVIRRGNFYLIDITKCDYYALLFQINLVDKFVIPQTKMEKLEETLKIERSQREKFTRDIKQDIENLKNKMHIQFGKTKKE